MSVGLLADVNHLWYDKYGLQDAEQRYFNPGAADSGDTAALRSLVCEMQKRIESLEKRVAQLERGNKQGERTSNSRSSKSEATLKASTGKENCAKQAPAPKAEQKDKKDDDFDLFGDEDEEESEEKKRVREERVKAYEEKKAKKPALIAKSQVILDVKPWDDETDMKEMERRVRTIEMDGLLWGVSKFVPIAFGVKKLQIVCVVEDDKVSTDELTERITDENEDLVQSVDIAAFQKI